MNTDERIEYERADQANDAAAAWNEAHALLSHAGDVAARLATLMDSALSATESDNPAQVAELTSDARAQARRIAEMVGDWG